jgi:hypothetical protein
MKLKSLPRFTNFRFLKHASCLATVLLLSACSMGQMVVRGTQTILDSGVESMNRETDLQLARDAMPANLKLIEGMLIEDPNIDPESSSTEELQAAVDRAGNRSVPALFWSASCLGKWIDLSRDSVTGIAGLSSAEILMRRVTELDDEFYFGGAHMFFGVYYGGRAPMFGGDFTLSEQHFQRAAEINNNKLLLVDVLQAEYLDRQKLDQQAFHTRLEKVVNAPDDLYPEMALVNGISKQKAKRLLEHEKDWF